MVTGDQPFLFHVIGDVSEFRMVILGMLVIRDEDYFLVIVINCSYITSPITDDDGYDTINPMGSKPILLHVPANHSLASGSRLTCIVSTS